jgi:cytoskeletal protein CcmA (bactofilin family)
MGLFGSKSRSDEQRAGVPNDGSQDVSKSRDPDATAGPSDSESRDVTQRTNAASSSIPSNHQARDRQTSSEHRPRPDREAKGESSMANIGQSIIFKGELTGDEDLEIDGQVEGTVHLTNNELTVGPNGHLKAEVNAKSIVVVGRVQGNLTATERIEIQSTGIVDGDLRAPRLMIAEGAVLNGGIDMTKGNASAGKPTGSSPTSPTPSGGSEEVRKSA